MRKRRTQAGRETWALICFIVAPALPPVTTKTAIKAVAYRAFQVGPEFPQSIIDEAAQERNGWPTRARVEARARELGLRLPETLTRNKAGPCEDDGEYLNRLRAMQRNAFGADAEALANAIRELERLQAL